MKHLFFVLSLAASAASLSGESFVISDLGNSPSEAPGWEWEAFADTVMGGSSELSPPIVLDSEDGKAFLNIYRVALYRQEGGE
jgi:hypothetical protein